MRSSRAGRRVTVTLVSAGVAAGVAATAACTPAAPADDAVAPSSSVVQPGSPGDPTTTLGPDELAERRGDPEYAQADVDYMTDMIEHHLQALEMSALAPDRARDPQVLAIADRIGDVQGSEVHALVGWLQERELPVPVDAEELAEQADGEGPRAPGGHDHDGDHADMPGMLSDAQLAALEDADGARFDELYLQGMIQHHRGAVDMSLTALDDGVDERVNELATEIGAGQEAEIGRLEDILAALG